MGLRPITANSLKAMSSLNHKTIIHSRFPLIRGRIPANFLKLRDQILGRLKTVLGSFGQHPQDHHFKRGRHRRIKPHWRMRLLSRQTGPQLLWRVALKRWPARQQAVDRRPQSVNV